MDAQKAKSTMLIVTIRYTFSIFLNETFFAPITKSTQKNISIYPELTYTRIASSINNTNIKNVLLENSSKRNTFIISNKHATALQSVYALPGS
jgi:hypothetical protein